LFAIGARDTTFAGNVADDNAEAGIQASATTRTRLLFNRASGTDRAAFFVFRSPALRLVGNLITGNRPTGETVADGGVVVSTGFDGPPPSDNVVRGNTILANDPDIAWDETGTGNVFRRNRCETSTPPNLC
jgi:hypothetical protein